MKTGKINGAVDCVGVSRATRIRCRLGLGVRQAQGGGAPMGDREAKIACLQL